MTVPPDDKDIPGGDDSDDEDEAGEIRFPDGLENLPAGGQRRKVKVTISQSAQEVKFADMFGFMLSQTHGIIRFGVFQPETGEFVVHSQIAMTPQGMQALSKSLQQNIEKARRKRKPGPETRMN
jgi:hypothetical protein